jgi:tetratricopeptide (TPR) repeat protein
MLWLTAAALASPLTLGKSLQHDDLDRAATAVLVSGWLDGSLLPSQQPEALRILLQLAAEHDDLSALSRLLDAGVELPAGVDAVHYLRGLSAWQADELALALEHLRQVAPDDPLSPRARTIEGIIHHRQGKLKSAVRAFVEVIRTPGVDPELHDRAILNIGRIYYEIERYSDAIAYLDLIGPDSAVWPDALLAKAWSYTMIGEIDEALGAILTLRSPRLADTFLPEARQLEALLYFQHCDYAETARLSALLRQDLTPMQAELSEVAGLTPLAVLDRWLGEEEVPSVLPVSLFSAMLRDHDLSAALVRIGDGTAELTADLDAQARDALRQSIDADRLTAGEHLKAAAAAQADALADLLLQAELLAWEVPGVSPGCTLGRQPPSSDMPYFCSLPRPSSVWPFNGEFWEDELGYYAVKIPSSCW